MIFFIMFRKLCFKYWEKVYNTKITDFWFTLYIQGVSRIQMLKLQERRTKKTNAS